MLSILRIWVDKNGSITFVVKVKEQFDVADELRAQLDEYTLDGALQSYEKFRQVRVGLS